MLAALAAMGVRRHEPDDIPACFGALSATIAEHVGARGAAFYLLHREGKDAGTVSVQRQAFGTPDAVMGRLSTLPLGTSADVLNRVVAQGEVVHFDRRHGAGQAGRPRLWLDALGAQDLVFVPWDANGTTLGAVAVQDSTRPDGFTADDIYMLRVLALGAGLVWERLAAQVVVFESLAGELADLSRHGEEMERLEQAKGDFLRLASHELRAPLSVVRGYAAMLQDESLGALNPAQKRAISILAGKAGELELLTEEMMETARLEEGRSVLSLSDVDLGGAVAAAVESVRVFLTPAHTLVIVDAEAEAGLVVEADALALATVLRNLVHNAIKYSPGGGAVRVQVSRQDCLPTVDVTDEGVGIAEEDCERLFTKFGRIQTSANRDIPGTGLGLYIARQLIELHGGRVTAAPAHPKGTRFRVQLPAERVRPRVA